jgi:hypothetical protein
VNWKQPLRAAIFIAGIALFARYLQVLGLEGIREALGRVGWGFALILLLSGAREVVRTLAWMRAVEGPVPLRFPSAFRARVAGEALNTLLPMGLAVGEPTKASRAGHDISFATAFSALAVEFAFYCASLLLLFGAGIPVFLALTNVRLGFPSIQIGLISGVVTAAVVVTGIRRTRRIGTAQRALVESQEGHVTNVVARTLNGVRDLRGVVFGFALRHPERVRAIVACEIAYQVFAVAEVYCTLLIVSPSSATIACAIVLETVSRAITMMFKILPMRVGVDEAGSSLFAGQLNLGAATGVTLALVRKLRLVFWSGLGLALLVRRPSRLARSESPSGIGAVLEAERL